jgi:hypothetical protein
MSIQWMEAWDDARAAAHDASRPLYLFLFSPT